MCFVVEQLSKHGLTTTMQQNLKILYVSMFVASFYGIATIGEEVHAFTNYVLHGLYKKLGKPKWELNQIFKMFGLPNYLGQK
jgi:hypothetical protein